MLQGNKTLLLLGFSGDIRAQVLLLELQDLLQLLISAYGGSVVRHMVIYRKKRKWGPCFPAVKNDQSESGADVTSKDLVNTSMNPNR